MRPPGLWSDFWSCPEHGAVAPVHPALPGSDDALRQIAERSQVPLWLPWPLPVGWLVTGVRYAGDEHSGPTATVLALSGPNPMTLDADDDLSAELLVIAEQPGVGLATRLAGLNWIDPGAAVATGAAAAKVVAAGHETPMWNVPVEHAEVVGLDVDPEMDLEMDLESVSAYVGEALGVWLWMLTWPRMGAAVLLESFALVDLRDPEHAYPLPYGALSPRLL